MLTITIPQTEYFDDEIDQFCDVKETRLILEHSLVSLSKWEAKWCKPFLKEEDKTQEELIDYIRCMTIKRPPNDYVYYALQQWQFAEISDYINAKMTATTFGSDFEKKPGPRSREIITSELIYYWMIQYQIPSDYEKWHLNRLLTLIRVCSIKAAANDPKGKKSNLKRISAINAARRTKLNSRG